MSRTFSLLMVLCVLMAAACVSVGGSDSVAATTMPAPATAEELRVFCDRYDEVRDRSRQEIMVLLVAVAPAEIIGPVKRASEIASSHEDNAQVDDYLARCG